jgi:hypothetical protein
MDMRFPRGEITTCTRIRHKTNKRNNALLLSCELVPKTAGWFKGILEDILQAFFSGGLESCLNYNNPEGCR